MHWSSLLHPASTSYGSSPPPGCTGALHCCNIKFNQSRFSNEFSGALFHFDFLRIVKAQSSIQLVCRGVAKHWGLRSVSFHRIDFSNIKLPKTNPRVVVLPSIEVSDTWLMNIPWSSVSFHKIGFLKNRQSPILNRVAKHWGERHLTDGRSDSACCSLQLHCSWIQHHTLQCVRFRVEHGGS